MQANSPPRITHGLRDCRTPVSAGLPELRGAREHCVGSRPTILLPCVESLLSPARIHGELVLRLPSVTVSLPGPQHHGLAATVWPAGVPRRLGGIRTRGAVLGGPGRYPRPHAVTGVPPHPSKSSHTQRPGSPPSPCKGVRSRPWRRG